MKPYATYTLIAITLLTQLTQLWPTVYYQLVLYPINHPMQHAWQYITYMFVHAPVNGPGILHLMFNMQLLYMFGRRIEAQTGALQFVGIYLYAGILTGCIATLMYSAFTWYHLPNLPVVGASGAIYALVTIFCLDTPDQIIRIAFTPLRFTARSVIWAMGMASGFMCLIPGYQQAAIIHLAGIWVGFCLYVYYLILRKQ